MSVSAVPSPQKVNVRSMISIFENQTISVENEPSKLVNLRRAKSMLNLGNGTRVVRTPIAPKRVVRERIQEVDPFESSAEINLELTQIEQQIQHLQRSLANNYKTYSKETHIYYQNQIIFILTDVGSLETKNDVDIIDKKSELTESLKRLNKKLNTLLPSSGAAKPAPKMFSRTISVDQHDSFNVRPVKENGVKVQLIQTQKREPEEEEDSVSVSVSNLKALFEKNTNESEGKTEFGATKISRKYLTFNGADLKYVPFSERFQKPTTDLDDTDFDHVESEPEEQPENEETPDTSDTEKANGEHLEEEVD